MNIFTKSLLAIGVLGLGATVATPAFAGDNAYASGSATMVLMNGGSQSIGAEIAAPSGPAFLGAGGADGNVIVSPSLVVVADGLSVNTATMNGLNVDPGQATLAPSATSSVEAAVAAQVVAAGIADATFGAGVSYTRAWVSGGLD